MIDLNYLYKTEKFMFLISGIYPNKFLEPKFLYKITGSIYFITCYIHLSSMLVSLYLAASDLTAATDILLYLMTQMCLTLKMTFFSLKGKQVLNIEKHLDSPLLRKMNKEEEKFIHDRIKSCLILGQSFRFLCAVVIFFYIVFPITDNTKGTYMYPMVLWFPFNPDNYYVIVYVCEIISICFGALSNSTIDVLTIKLISIATGEIDILKKRLRNVTNGKHISHEDIYYKLRYCVVHYEAIYRFVNAIESLFSNGIFIQFFASVVVICMSGFQLIVLPYSMQYFVVVFYFVVMMFQIFMYCWYGHLIMESSEGISLACYMSEWNKCDIKSRKAMMMIMERSKRSIKLTAGSYFILNLSTLMAVFKSSYSYFAVLQRLNKE